MPRDRSHPVRRVSCNNPAHAPRGPVPGRSHALPHARYTVVYQIDLQYLVASLLGWQTIVDITTHL
jgi:hypothetical protein